jgi:hypothetical protein
MAKDFGQVIRDSDPNTLRYGTATVGTTAAQFTSTATALAQGVSIKALAANTNTVYVGSDSSVTNSNGYPLAAGEEVFIIVNDLSKVWIYGGAASQVARYIAS